MIIATIQDIRSRLIKLGSEKSLANIIRLAFDLNGLTWYHEWITFTMLDELGSQYARLKGWDPDTTLMLCEPPFDNKNCDPVSDEIWERENKEITQTNHTRCMCAFFPNMNVDKFAHMINRVVSMKAFI